MALSDSRAGGTQGRQHARAPAFLSSGLARGSPPCITVGIGVPPIRPRGCGVRGLSPPVRNLTDPGTRFYPNPSAPGGIPQFLRGRIRGPANRPDHSPVRPPVIVFIVSTMMSALKKKLSVVCHTTVQRIRLSTTCTSEVENEVPFVKEK